MHEQTWPTAATSQAADLALDWKVFAVVGFFVALLVISLLAYALIRWRRRDNIAPPQFRNNVPLEVFWTAVPLVMVIALFLFTYHIELKVDAIAAKPQLEVQVNAYRWGWTFAYPGGPTISGASASPILGRSAAPPPDLVLPVNETTRIDLTSSDVNHAFWVPDFLFKRDAIPGRMTSFDLKPTQIGTFIGHCAEFCGIYHGIMIFRVRVVSLSEFVRWRNEARKI